MDLKVYYRKVREVLETIPTEFAVIVSRETPDGGKPGVMAETVRALAARLVVDGRARLATEAEASEFLAREAKNRAEAQEELAPARWPVTVLSERDLAALKAVRQSSETVTTQSKK